MAEIKEDGKKLIHDLSDMAKLTIDGVKQEIHQEVTKQKVKNKIDDMQCAYHNMKQEVKETILDKLDSL